MGEPCDPLLKQLPLPVSMSNSAGNSFPITLFLMASLNLTTSPSRISLFCRGNGQREQDKTFSRTERGRDGTDDETHDARVGRGLRVDAHLAVTDAVNHLLNVYFTVSGRPGCPQNLRKLQLFTTFGRFGIFRTQCVTDVSL